MKTKLRPALLALVIAALSSCNKAGDPAPVGSVTDTGRFTAEYQTNFTAASASRDHGVFIITDSGTGAQYLAIEGCGVSALGGKGVEE